MADFLPPDSSRPTPPEPLPIFKPLAIADVEYVTGLVLDLDDTGWYVLVRRATWPKERFAAIDAPTWVWLGDTERRATFAAYAVMLPSDDHPQLKAFAGATRWDPG